MVWDTANPYRPFCSERCKMIDLGAWATESYRIPVPEDDEIAEGDEASDSESKEKRLRRET